MMVYGDFAIGKCGNADVYFLVDADIAEDISQNVWTLDGHGYACRNKGGKMQLLHRLVMEMATGRELPRGMYIDHINQCKTDNRLCNLRIVNPTASAMNMPLKSDNTSGVTGVSRGRNGIGWRAYISVNKKRIELGTYPTIEAATMARHAAEERYGYTHRQDLAAFLIEMEGGDGHEETGAKRADHLHPVV